MLKAPQKREVLNWGLSLSYDVETSMTTGILYGTGLKNGDDHRRLGSRSPMKMFVESIRTAIEAWDHPMLLPCLFLSEHLTCINIFCTQGTVTTETVEIENQLGVTKVGQSAYFIKDAQGNNLYGQNPPYRIQHMGIPGSDTLSAPPSLSRQQTEELTVRINTQSTRVVFTARSPEWNLACARFILTTLEEIEVHLDKRHVEGHYGCTQLLDHNIILAEAAAHLVAVIKERMALQLNVLYNVVAQLDNQTSAELAASTSRDSTSMKILAFISALFLPGSFVSALFSMGMFDWRSERGPVLSNTFYIWWAVAIPLTAVTVFGWAAWWYFELDRFNKRLGNLRGRQETKATS